ncbi:MAG TPA: 16S rRNA (cytidine(1402)-2'-O)-methyltransferase [Candidatus Dojkabacteria bacterium]|nr:16S rRNA (cytidine(1402)-2'-O)-methyltransferase [Candidatus Dojkabacteria bacterium]
METKSEGKGILYIVATPIGNLEDMTFRAVRILKEVAFVLAEDTRQTSKLLNHYNISAQLVSYRDQNHDRMIGKVMEKLDLGLNLALVSDSGTPVISDPGFKLVRELVSRGYKVSPIPGPSAVVSALSASGVATDKFIFLGFLPKSDAHRKDLLKEYGSLNSTLVMYESPQRIGKLLQEIIDTLPSRRVTLANDITKMHEAFDTDYPEKLLELVNDGKIKQKGEFVVLVDKE